MTSLSNPFPVSEPLSPDLARVHAYWRGLVRGDNDMPFWDDVNLSDLPDLTGRLLLLDVFAKPERFRFNVVGADFLEGDADFMASKFADEMELHGRLGYLGAQASATVEAAAPTLYRHGGSSETGTFSRLLLPMWGDGHIGMLLGALDAS